jgi:LAO/AO transport system kinase
LVPTARSHVVDSWVPAACSCVVGAVPRASVAPVTHVDEAPSASPRSELAARVLAGEMRAAARAMRLVDDRGPGYLDLLKGLYPHTGRAWIVGITGTPGAGKSTLTDRLVEHERSRGKKVGVVAVDPTSPYTGGAILGDRIRMQRHFLDPNVFIRSLATRGHLGGLSRSAGDVIRVLDAYGCDTIFVETVGVGQDELEVTRLAQTTIVVMAPGMGDDIQAIKAGILEVADVFAVNKADREGADATVRDLEQMIALTRETAVAAASASSHSAAHAHRIVREERAEGGPWEPPVVKTIASRNENIGALVAACDAHRAHLDATDEGDRKRVARAREELAVIFRDTLLGVAAQRVGAAQEAAVARLLAREDDPYSVSEALVGALLAGASA